MARGEPNERTRPTAVSRQPDGSRLIVRHSADAHPHLSNYFILTKGFNDLCRLPSDSGAKSKAAHLVDMAGDLVYIVQNWRQIRAAREIIAMGPMAVNVAVMLRVGLLPRCERFYWFGLFIHDPRWIRRLRYPLRALDSERTRYVLFSGFEKELYVKELGLKEQRLCYVPYGDLSGDTEVNETTLDLLKEVNDSDFFFSGGYSNRDYPQLIAVFGELPYKLVIVCSRLNTEVNESVLPSNITVIRDAPSDRFDAYVARAAACIIPIAHNTGAAGQSCLLRYMKQGKIIIATNTGIVSEYITDRVSGILVDNNRTAMADAVRAVASNADAYKGYGNAAMKRFREQFCGEAIARRLDEMMSEPIDGRGNA